jgi:penicillin-binding protein 2
LFEKRLRWLAVLLALLALGIVVRLIDIQIVRASELSALADAQLVGPVRYCGAARGDILDRAGRVLVRDVPSFDVCVHFAVLAGRSEPYLAAAARQMRRRGEHDRRSAAEIVAELRHAVSETWPRLSELTGVPVAALLERGEQVRRRVERVREAVAARTGVTQPVAEEFAYHALVEGLDDATAMGVRLALERYPWIDVTPGTHRARTAPASLVHVLGRTGPATDELLERDPLADDDLRRLRAGESCGVSGVERAADVHLRGTRGRVVTDADGHETSRCEPVHGRDMYLTIDSEIQQRVLEILAAAVESSEHPSGGSAVVIDVATRDVVALVSYPVYDAEALSRDYERLRDDARRTPLRFRAVADQYAAGSVCKLITLVGGLSDGVVEETERIHCTGFLLPEKPNMLRCWIYNQYGVTHDAGDPAGQDAEHAVAHSCNIYFFRVGQRLGAERLCAWFDRFGLGRRQGSGLIEESAAINPTEEWLRRRAVGGRGFDQADAWNFSIGQGEITVTPLQTANVIASVAAGRWEPVYLMRDAAGVSLPASVGRSQPFDEQAVRVARRGMWRVVNERGGTAFEHATLGRPDYELCGKTGSAQATPRVLRWRYTLQWADGRRETVLATDAEQALAGFDPPKPTIVRRDVAERFPVLSAEGKLPAHAWFAGFTQLRSTPRGGAPRGQVYAIAVVIEFGGSGGHVAAPVGRQIALELLGRNEWGLGHRRVAQAR